MVIEKKTELVGLVWVGLGERGELDIFIGGL